MKENNAILGFYGYSNSGKTSTIFRLIGELSKEQLRIGVIKRTDKAISSEPAGKDTYGFRSAGAQITAFSSEIETNFVYQNKESEQEIIHKMLMLQDVDVVLVEGSTAKATRKIRFGEIPIRENTIWTYDNDFEKLRLIVLDQVNKKGE